MPAILVEVPAHVQHQTHVQNGVKVEGGSNWDLSRAALETPITPLAPLPTPLPDYAAGPSSTTVVVEQLAVVSFAHNSAKLSATAQKALSKLKATDVSVKGYASPLEAKPTLLSQRRAEAVASALEKKGFVASSVSAEGASNAENLKKSSAVDRVVRVLSATARPE